MCSILIADDELIIVKQLFNDIIERNQNIKLIGITNNGKEVLNWMENNKPDILLLDLMMPKMNGIEVLDKLIEQKDKYLTKTKIIIISSYLEQLYDSDKYRNYIYATLPKPYNIDKLMELINAVDSEIRDNDIDICIQKELEKFNFNRDTEAYKYLKETIHEIIYKNNDKFKLEGEIYNKVAIMNKKSTIQIKWTIEKMMDIMYINTRYDIIKEYFNFKEYKKPTTKNFIKNVVENINDQRADLVRQKHEIK